MRVRWRNGASEFMMANGPSTFLLSAGMCLARPMDLAETIRHFRKEGVIDAYQNGYPLFQYPGWRIGASRIQKRSTTSRKVSMRVLFAASEIYPLAKTGGLADVSGALPLSLAHLGVDVRLVLPGYPQALAAAANKKVKAELGGTSGIAATRLIAARTPDSGLPLWLVDCPSLFQRQGALYCDPHGRDWPDNAQRFAHFNKVVARLALGEFTQDWRPDVVHANDWQTGLLPVLLAKTHGMRPTTLFTIHNLAYQGLFPIAVFSELGLPAEICTPDGIEFYGKLSFLKAGIRYSDRVTTVSPSYAREIITPEYGCGLDGLLRDRASDLSGILNGVDYRIWDPASDSCLPVNFSQRDISGKRICKAELQRELGLQIAPDVPLIVWLSRITGQKMADVVIDALPTILKRDVQFALLGQGDPVLASRFEKAARYHRGRVATRIGYQEPLAHRFQAGGDILLHPSRFEPCGLTPLYALRYGTLPVVRGVGGFADTIVDADERTIPLGTATGFAFTEANANAMVKCLDHAIGLYAQPIVWRKMQRRAMSRDFGWGVSARRYLSLYRQLAPRARPVELHDEPLLDRAAG